MYDPEQPLYHKIENKENKESIVLIHGAFSNTLEWINVTKHLSEYRIIIPNLFLYEDKPGCIAIRPMTLERSARLLSQLIRESTPDSKAHVVGFSLGAGIAVHLASTFPDMVKTLFISGYGNYNPSEFTKGLLPSATYIVQNLAQLVPNSISSQFMSGARMNQGGQNMCTMSVCRDVVDMMTSNSTVKPIPARTLAVVAGKRGLLPTNDSIPSNLELLEQITQPPGSQNSRAVLAPNMRHPWLLQDPLLFAQCVVAWIEGLELPDELEQL